ncbi:MAG: hydroxyisourate hydrolase [Bacteroidetes bacterium]|nr:MAG: hydroxyisourate hydrolase [Bacteroidota bacterium]
MSQVTTHILDTSKGEPAQKVTVHLERPNNSDGWVNISTGLTDKQGRISDFLPTDEILEAGIYRLVFETSSYFSKQGVWGFYPLITIVFEIRDKEHYHVPLLLNPYGYSTYRGT